MLINVRLTFLNARRSESCSELILQKSIFCQRKVNNLKAKYFNNKPTIEFYSPGKNI